MHILYNVKKKDIRNIIDLKLIFILYGGDARGKS